MTLRSYSLRAVALGAISAALAACSSDRAVGPVGADAIINQAVATEAGLVVASLLGLHDTGEAASGTAAGALIPMDGGVRPALAPAATASAAGTTCQVSGGKATERRWSPADTAAPSRGVRRQSHVRARVRPPGRVARRSEC